jgi:hypothetical protein
VTSITTAPPIAPANNNSTMFIGFILHPKKM